ncbi:General stress protein 26 [Gillisia sp. Hel1_33_143]|uniref:pyridoxamine 5'-phosphate oxidase family protein n=1 Tax=Gillisia sp. Hel1_33_143 TaxID=1336796 RepID=UPI00087DC108|nr:pyridoxamine 5'-phosphate oxidase family protein [Gillisia sp. Hel1_33_143]SDS15140.1 General stress protein 26 [Gillisia sp. Hel1_33_143]
MSTKNLTSQDALDKMMKLVDDIDFCMMLTDLKTTPISAIPMSTKKVDENGDIWFLSGMNSDHNTNIVRDSKVQLLYSKPSDMEFISIFGHASIVTDKSILKDLYGKTDDAWFDGVDDPNLTAIKFDPNEAYYWDTKQNKYISLFKMGVAALTGDKADVGEKGKLNV